MRISGFTVVKNAVKLNYPIVESIRSILPICDEYIVNVGRSDDGTLELIKGMNEPKIRIIETDWDFSKGFTELARQTNIALKECKGDWAFYLQSDEIIHEKDLWKLKAWMKFYLNSRDVDALRFWWLHFYGSHHRYRIDQGWYQKQDRIIRNNGTIESYHDAYGFRRKDAQPMKVKNTYCFLYHYGWTYTPEQMTQRKQNASELWQGSFAQDFHYDYGNLELFPKYFGSHPKVMTDIIASNPLTQEDGKKIAKHYWWHPLRILKLRYKTFQRERRRIDPLAKDTAKKFLIVRAGNIGDVLMITPVARKLKAAFPGCRVDFVTSPQARVVLDANRNIDNIFLFRKNKNVIGKIKRFIFERYLVRYNYDYCFVFELHPQYHAFAAHVGGKTAFKAGYKSIPSSSFMDFDGTYSYEQKHVIEHALSLMRDVLKIPITVDDYKMDFIIPHEVEEVLNASLPAWKGASGRYFVIHPGCTVNMPLRAWVMTHYAEVVSFLREQGYRVFLTGGGTDRRFIEEILTMGADKDKDVDVFLDRPMNEMAFLLKHASGILCSDTGIMHLARAVGTPVVSLFGPSNPGHTGCIGLGTYVQIRNDFKCGPCNYTPQYRYEDKKGCLDGLPPACMGSITVNQVKGAIKDILAKGRQ